MHDWAVTDHLRSHYEADAASRSGLPDQGSILARRRRTSHWVGSQGRTMPGTATAQSLTAKQDIRLAGNDAGGSRRRPRATETKITTEQATELAQPRMVSRSSRA